MSNTSSGAASVAQRMADVLAQLKPLYTAIQANRAEFADLHHVEAAVAAHKAAVAELQTPLDQLTEQEANLSRRVAELETRKRRLARDSARSVSGGSRLGGSPLGGTLRRTARNDRTPAAAVSPQPLPTGAGMDDRRRLQKLLGRYARGRLQPTVLGEINRIALDSSRPLGEALALLAWDEYYVAPLHTRESPDEHLARLELWADELAIYDRHLQDEIQALRTKHRQSLAIWERWRRREADADGAAAWTRFLAETRAAQEERLAQLRQRCAELQQQIQDLQAEIAALGNETDE